MKLTPEIPELATKHKGTHFACSEIMESMGGKAWCCKCVGHACLRPMQKKPNLGKSIKS
jgi:hypothetical protein